MEGIPSCFGFGVPQPMISLTTLLPWGDTGTFQSPLSPKCGLSLSTQAQSEQESQKDPRSNAAVPRPPCLRVCLDLSLPLCLCVSLSMSLSLLTQPSESANFKPGFSLK